MYQEIGSAQLDMEIGTIRKWRVHMKIGRWNQWALEFADRQVGLLRSSDPQEELSLHAGIVGGRHQGIVALGQLGLQGDGPVVGVGHPPDQKARHRELHGPADPLVQLEEGEPDGEEGVVAKLVTQLPPSLLHQGNAHLELQTCCLRFELAEYG